MTDTITLGYYIQKLDGYDTIVCWVNTPNNLRDTLTTYDDTLTVIAYGCSKQLAGIYTVGKGAAYDFKDMDEALLRLRQCGVSGDMELKLASGIYKHALDFSDFKDILGRYRLTVSSMAKNADSVVFCPIFGDVVTFNQSSHLVFRNLTFTADSASGRVVLFASSCEDIEFNRCYLKGLYINATTNTHAVISGPTAVLDDIRFIGNRIAGGDYGIYLSNDGKRVLFDSNYIENSYIYPVYTSHVEIQFLHNTLNEIPGYTYFYGPTFYYPSNSRIEGNRIITNGYANNQYGMQIYYSDATTMVCNNEVAMLNNKSNTYGLYLNQPTGLVIVNNSLYLRGSASTFYGMSFNNTNNNRDFVIRNNNVVIDSGVKATNAYPLSMPSNTNLSHWDIDYNNWYSSRYMGNIGNIAIENLLDFQAALITPQHESNVFPDFNDKTDLHMRHTGTLTCPSFAEVALDKDGAIRMVLTNRGCYRGELDSANASLSALLDWPAKNTLVGDTLRPSVVMQNSGLLTLNSATIGWSVNGVQQPSIKWSGRLQTGMTDTIALGKYVCMNGSNGMAAYLEAIGTLKDAVAEDDTVKASNYSCDAALNGQYTVGANGRFATLNDAFFALEQCGLDGPVELLVTSGTQNNISIQGLFPGADSTHKVTVRSIAQHYDSVIVSGEIAMLLANTGHLRFEDISFAGNQVGVKMEDSVVDVVFHRCGISAAYSSSNTACCAVSYPGASNSYVLDDVHFIANTIQGGYYGISLQYAHSNNSVMPLTRGIYIDSNTVSGSYTGINVSNYCHVPSISHNTIRSIYTGISFSSYCIGKKVEGNRIYVQNTTAGGQATGISCGTFLNNTVDTTLFINNEIRVEGDGLCHGLNMTFLGVCHMEAHHNSVYVTSKSNAARGIYTIIPYLNQGQSSGNRITRNLLVTDGTSNYPFYIESQARMGPGQQSMIILPIGTGYTRREWNNLYSSTDVAYAGSVAKTIADLQAITNQDGNSISAPPASGPFPCPSMVEVTTDINGMTRDSSTYIGCYHRQIDSSDAALTGLLGVENICSMKSVPVQAVIRNDGYKSIDSAVITILIDSVKQAIVRYVPSQPLAYLQSDTVALGGYRLPNGPHEILAYVKMRNDSLSDNDTIRYIRTVCDSAFRGIYIVGNSKQADYTFGELDSLFARMNICGVSGDVTIAFENGSYSGVIDLSAIANAMEGHHLTLTSVSGNSRDAAIITGTSRTLTIGSSNKNVTVKNLALQNTGSGTVISLFDGCENINILHNWLLKDSINPSGNIIQKEFSSYQSTGIIRNINIIGNLIVGGNRGVYLDVNGGASSIYWSDGIVIDSNEMAGQYSSAIYVNHENVRSISHNKIRNLVTASGTYHSWHGIDLSQSQNDSIMGNEIDAFHANVANIYPMYLGLTLTANFSHRYNFM